MSSYRRVGARLGAYIVSKDPTTQQIQAFLSDLLAGDDLLQPMRDVVTRTHFATLQALAGTGGGSIQRDSCLQELSRSYLPMVVDRVGDFLDGMLDKPLECSFSTSQNNAPGKSSAKDDDLWFETNSASEIAVETALGSTQSDQEDMKRLRASEVCDENLWNRQRDPEKDKVFLKAWNLRWFNKRYRPRLERD
jgi:hypothetical protein